MNGSWLGSGFKFRTLNLDGTFGDQNLRISGFHAENGQQLELHVDDDTLQGYIPGQPDPVKLDNSKITIERQIVGGVGRTTGRTTYTFKIMQVLSQNSWTADIPPRQVPLYQFEVTNNDDGCNVPLCKPGLSDDDHNDGRSGTAVIFRGDTYNEYTYEVAKVSRSGGPPFGNDHGVFNIACLGTAISKLDLLGHTSASTADTTSTGQRQAMLRLLTADYCGIGKSFTDDGLPIRLGFQNVFQLSNGSKYDLTSSVSIDALWNQDGATCIGQPRKAGLTVSQIQDYCKQAYLNQGLARRAPEVCVPTQPTMATLNTSGAMALSANPAAP